MRRPRLPSAAFALCLSALAACHSHYREPARDAGDPAGPWGASLAPEERARLAATDALILAELSSAPDAARLDADARALGLSGAGELAAALERDCLEPSEVGRFASASGVGERTAESYLEARFGAAACGASAR
jgi:hypothetical protein